MRRPGYLAALGGGAGRPSTRALRPPARLFAPEPVIDPGRGYVGLVAPTNRPRDRSPREGPPAEDRAVERMPRGIGQGRVSHEVASLAPEPGPVGTAGKLSDPTPVAVPEPPAVTPTRPYATSPRSPGSSANASAAPRSSDREQPLPDTGEPVRPPVGATPGTPAQPPQPAPRAKDGVSPSRFIVRPSPRPGDPNPTRAATAPPPLSASPVGSPEHEPDSAAATEPRSVARPIAPIPAPRSGSMLETVRGDTPGDIARRSAQVARTTPGSSANASAAPRSSDREQPLPDTGEPVRPPVGATPGTPAQPPQPKDGVSPSRFIVRPSARPGDPNPTRAGTAPPPGDPNPTRAGTAPPPLSASAVGSPEREPDSAAATEPRSVARPIAPIPAPRSGSMLETVRGDTPGDIARRSAQVARTTPLIEPSRPSARSSADPAGRARPDASSAPPHGRPADPRPAAPPAPSLRRSAPARAEAGGEPDWRDRAPEPSAASLIEPARWSPSAEPRAGLRAPRRVDAPEPPRLHIGTIEVTVVPPASPPAPPRRRPQSTSRPAPAAALSAPAGTRWFAIAQR